VRATDIIRESLDLSDMIVTSYIGDLSDDDLKVVPLEGMNPIALQIGHLIEAERMFAEGVRPGSSPALPEGFAAKHSLKEGNPADASRYATKDEYLRLWKAQREATKSVLASLSDAELDQPGPESMRSYAPTVGAVMSLASGHVLMHVGQWVALRRKLHKPVTI
jgi:hypothetical protein